MNSIASATNKLDLKVKFKLDKYPTLTLRYIPIRTQNDATFADTIKTTLIYSQLYQAIKLREDINFKKIPLTLSVSVSYNVRNTDRDNTKISGLGLTGAYKFFEIWSNSLGLNYTKESGVNSKLGLSFTSEVPVWILGDFFLTAEQSFYGKHSISLK